MRRLLGVGAVVGAGAMIMAACGSGSGSGSSGANTTIPGAITSTTVKGQASKPTASAAPKGLYGALPPVGTPTKGGTITAAELTGDTPEYILPITPASSSSVYTTYDFQNNLWPPLYESPDGATPKIAPNLSAAELPVFSANRKTVTIKLKPNFKWSDGQPVTANDVIFYIDLVKQAVKESAANYNNYTPGYFPDNVTSAVAQGSSTVVLHVTKAYNEAYFTDDQLGLLYAFPSTKWNIASANGPHLNYAVPANAKKIYDYLAKQGSDLSTFASNPLWQDVYGPYKLTGFTPSTGAYTMKPNPSYGGSPTPSASISMETYTSITPLLNALKSGDLDFGPIDFSQLGQVNSLRSLGYSVYGYPAYGFFTDFFNFKDKTADFDKVISQLYVRQAMAHLVDQPAYVSGIFKNAAGQAYGPVPSLPASPFAPANAATNPYPFSVSAASSLLTSHGWSVKPGGTTTCTKPGTAADECGAGIPAGTPISFSFYYENESPSSGLSAEAFQAEAAHVGIKVTLTAKTFTFLFSTYDDADPADAKYDNTWGVNGFGGFTDDIYPTTNSIFNTTGDYNNGAYSSPEANKLINASVFGTNTNAVMAEASYLTAQVPGLFQPESDYIYAVKKGVGGTSTGWLAATQDDYFYQYWYLTK